MSTITAKKQNELFEHLKQKSGLKGNLFVKNIGTLLGIGKSSVYARMRGDIALTMEEVMLLTRHYPIPAELFSINEIDQAKPEIIFPALHSEPVSFADYFNSLLIEMRSLLALPEVSVIYLTNEIPFFHYFHFPELAAFKMFIWARTVWNWDEFQDIRFDPANTPWFSANETLIDEMLDFYISTPHQEFWSRAMLNNTLYQIVYYAKTDVFVNRKRTAKVLLGQVRQLIKKFDRESRVQKSQSQFQLFVNELTFTNNIILVLSGSQPVRVFYTYDNPNFMMSGDPKLCSYTLGWVERISKRCVEIGRHNEATHVNFFTSLREQINTI